MRGEAVSTPRVRIVGTKVVCPNCGDSTAYYDGGCVKCPSGHIYKVRMAKRR